MVLYDTTDPPYAVQGCIYCCIFPAYQQTVDYVKGYVNSTYCTYDCMTDHRIYVVRVVVKLAKISTTAIARVLTDFHVK